MRSLYCFTSSRISQLSLLIIGLGLLLGTGAMPAGALPGGGDNWAYPDHYYRREVQLPADPSQARTNAPVWVDLKQFGSPVDIWTIKVDEITNGTAVPCTAAAYAQPSGRDPRAYWSAPGTTAAGQTRRFLIYYNKVSAQAAYTFSWRANSSFGSNSTVQEPLQNWDRYHYTLAGDRVRLERWANTDDKSKDSNHAHFFGNNKDYTKFTDLTNSFNPLSGLRFSYTFYGAQFSEQTMFGGEGNFDAIKWDRNGPTIAMNAHYTFSSVLAHQCELTHRIFQGQPLLEFSVTATPNAGSPLDFSNDIYSAREFSWNTGVFTPARMVTDLAYDGAPTWDSNSKNYIILSNGGNKALGLFTFKPSPRVKYTSELAETGAGASEQGSIYLYYAVGSTTEIKTLFDTMKRGYPLGNEQTPSFTVMQPDVDYERYFTGESISVTVSGPAAASDMKLRVDYPDGTYQVLNPSSAMARSNVFNLGTVTASSKFGTWVLTATGSGTSRYRKLIVSNPDHPRLLFTKSDLVQMRARWASDKRYYDKIQYPVVSEANSLKGSAPSPPADMPGKQPRDYGRHLMSFAGALLMDPAQSAIRTRMWQDFRAMMAWPQWDPIRNGVKPFQYPDVQFGEVLMELACVYDWFFDDLSAADKRKYAELFANYADALPAQNLAWIAWPRWQNYNVINNSREVGQCAGIALVDRLTELEIPAARHAPWKSRLDKEFGNLLQVLSPDGTTNAGESYNGLLMWYLFFWGETRRLNTGDLSLYNTAWFRELPNYIMFGLMPGRVGNFGGMMDFGNCDSAPFYSLQTLMGLPGLRGNGVAQWLAENVDHGVIGPFQGIWADYSKPKTDPQTLPNWHYFYKRGIFAFRSSWGNDAMYFTAKCGDYWGGHEHPDAGTFILHRNGYPYIAASQYVQTTLPTDENYLLADGLGPRGRSGSMYSDATDPATWGKTMRVLGSPDYFNLVQNPQPTYENGITDTTKPKLTAYNREYVGFDDLVILRDTMAASANMNFQLLLHGFKTDPQTDKGDPYDPYKYPGSTVFSKTSDPAWTKLYPNLAASPGEYLNILDRSRTGWTRSIAPWMLCPVYLYSSTPSARGEQMTRSYTGTSASSLQILSFRNENNYGARAWNATVADDGVVIYGSGGSNDSRLKVVWPKGARLNSADAGSEGLKVFGTMGMRNYENRDFGGRDLVFMRDDSAGMEGALMSSDVPVTMVSKTAALGTTAYITCDGAANVSIYCPMTVYSASFNGKPVAFKPDPNYTRLKQFAIPAAPLGGTLVLQTTPKPQNSVTQWDAYQ